jgi:AcrR family transcriptional regulator
MKTVKSEAKKNARRKKNGVKKKVRQAKRGYNNSKRSEKSLMHRQQIIELYVNLLVDGNGQDVPLQVLAKKSGISLRTLFRFFGDKETLNQEIDNYLTQYLTSASENLNKMNFANYAEYSFTVFEQYERLFKAYLYTDFGQKSRALFRKKFNSLLLEKIKNEEQKDSSERHLQELLIVSLINAHLWKDIKDSFGVSGTQMAPTIRWAVETLLQNRK